MSARSLIAALVALVPSGARVLDLGCGDGALMQALRERKGCSGYGIEIDDANLLESARRGIDVLQWNLEDGLSLFADQSFDVVLQIDTLQTIHRTERMLLETARVGKLGIVAFPNFAHWPNRLRVLGGRMPVTRALPYEWHNTPNVRVGTYADFEVLAERLGLTITQSFGLENGQRVDFLPNLLASTAIFCFQRG